MTSTTQTNETIFKYANAINLCLDPQFAIEKHILEYKSWEPHLFIPLTKLIREGDCCIDIGANAGYHTLLFALLTGENGSVHAFEPNKLTLERLKKNLDLNPNLSKQVIIRKLGLSDTTGQLKIFLAGGYGNAYLSESFNEKLSGTDDSTEHYDECRVDTLDNLFAEEKVDFLKIDVEGMELEVITGGIKTIKKNKPVIIYETLLDCFDHHKMQDIELVLEKLGYVLFNFGPKSQKLIRTAYPYYGPDTFAIHEDKLDCYQDIIKDIYSCKSKIALDIKKELVVEYQDLLKKKFS